MAPKMRMCKAKSQCAGVRRWGLWEIIRTRCVPKVAPCWEECPHRRKRYQSSLQQVLVKGHQHTQPDCHLYRQEELSALTGSVGPLSLDPSTSTSGEKYIYCFSCLVLDFAGTARISEGALRTQCTLGLGTYTKLVQCGGGRVKTETRTKNSNCPIHRETQQTQECTSVQH